MNIVRLEDANDANEYGGKATQLGAALRAGLPVPPGYAVSVGALTELQDRHRVPLARVQDIVQRLGPPVAARSSAVGEDSKHASFAGQHVTVLNLMDEEAVLDGLARVYDSAHSDAALAYREKKGVHSPVRMAAVVQKLVDSDCAGVLFTRNPMTGARELVIEAAWGLGEAVVAGIVTPDQYRVEPGGKVVEVRIGEKDLAVRRVAGGGTEETEVEAGRVHARCLDDSALARLAALADRCERHMGEHLDLEWAFVGNDLYLLQSRPIST